MLINTDIDVTTKVKQFLRVPYDLSKVLDGQVERYMTMKPFKELDLGEVEYRRGLENAVQAFIEEKRWDKELAKIGLRDVVIFDSRLTGKFLANAGGTYYYIDPDRYHDYKNIIVPSGIYTVQAQLGSKYKDIAPSKVQACLISQAEQPLTVKEGLNVVALRGCDFLRVCCMYLLGTSTLAKNGVLCLSHAGDEPQLTGWWGGGALEGFGVATRGKINI